MPELPEAEAQRRLLDRCVVGQTIERVETKEQGGGARDGQVDDKVLDGDVASLAGSRVVAANRKGKQLWLELDKGKNKGQCLLIHLGMTGSCVIKGEAPPSYKAFSIDDAFPPKYTKLELVMGDGTRLAYCPAALRPHQASRRRAGGAGGPRAGRPRSPSRRRHAERVELEVGSDQGRAARPVCRRLWHRQLGRGRSTLHV